MHYFAKPQVFLTGGTAVGEPSKEYTSLVRSEYLIEVVEGRMVAKTARTPAVQLRCRKGHLTGSAIYLQVMEGELRAFYDSVVRLGPEDTCNPVPAIERPFAPWGSITIRCLYCIRVQTRSAAYGIDAATVALAVQGGLACGWMT